MYALYALLVPYAVLYGMSFRSRAGVVFGSCWIRMPSHVLTVWYVVESCWIRTVSVCLPMY